jgi:hypothetical protein
MKYRLIGDNAFLGISHISQSRGRSKQLSLDTEAKVKLIEAAGSCGATGFTFSADPTNFHVLRRLTVSDQISKEFAIYPVLPYAARYVRAINEKGITGLMNDVLSQLSLAEKAKFIVQGSISTLTFDPIGAMMAYIDSELSQIPRNSNIQSVLLHEVITDLGISFGAIEMFESFIRHIRGKWHTMPGFVTRNFPSFVSRLHEMNLPLNDILVMTPFNSIGFQMNPSKQSCEECLSKMEHGNVFAMSILAGGYLSLTEAVAYIKQLPNLSGIVAGMSSLDHAERTFKSLRELD